MANRKDRDDRYGAHSVPGINIEVTRPRQSARTGAKTGSDAVPPKRQIEEIVINAPKEPPRKKSAPKPQAAVFVPELNPTHASAQKEEHIHVAQPNAELNKRKKAELERRLKELDLFTPRTKPRNYFINLFAVTFKMLLVCFLIFAFSGAGAVLGMAKAYLESIPVLDFSVVDNQEQTSLIYDAEGNMVQRYYGSENREWVSIEDVPLQLQNAFIAIEDVRFRRHLGIDLKRLLGSFILNMSSNSLQGGSTITQQLIKNTMLSFEQTYKRKIQEAYLAIELEKQYTKDQILEAYLNTIYLGGSNYGIKTAAKDFFGKELKDLTLRECATLAGMTQNPSKYNPRTNYFVRNKPQQTDNRANTVLMEMYENGFIDKAAYDAAKADTITVLETSPYTNDNEMPYFLEYVMSDVVTQLLEKEGLEDTTENRTIMKAKIRTEGYRIYTTLDTTVQQSAEQAVYNYKKYPSMRYDSDNYTIVGRNPDGTVIRLIQPQTAVVITDYRTGYIKAMVGGRQAPENALEYNRAYQSTMPVGSAIKPISVYGPAIDNGMGPGSILYDIQAPIKGWDTESGYPQNNSRSYSGPVTMRTAIVKSLNTCAAQTLMYDVGVEASRDVLISLGVDPSHINADGPGLALGTSGITPLEMAGAYGAIANMGEYVEPISFTKITDMDGNVVLDMTQQQEKRRVFKESTAWLLMDMLYSVTHSGGTGSNALVSGQTIYGKTGTNSDNRGVFFAGFSGYYVGTVWIGSDAYKPLTSDSQGGRYAAPLFSAVMTAVHKGLPNQEARNVTAASLGIKKVAYCNLTGKIAGASCPSTHTDWAYVADAQVCDVHVSMKICTVSGKLAGQYCPEETCEYKNFKVMPKDGIMPYLYQKAPNIFKKYFGTVTTTLDTCTYHTTAWQADENAKEAMSDQIQSLLVTAQGKADNTSLPDEERIALTNKINALDTAYKDLSKVTLAQLTTLYNNLDTAVKRLDELYN